MNSTVKTSGRFKARSLRAGVQLFLLSQPPLHFFSLAPFFARPKCKKLPCSARISFASYGNASFPGFPQTCQYTPVSPSIHDVYLTVYRQIRVPDTVAQNSVFSCFFWPTLKYTDHYSDLIHLVAC